MVAADKDPVRAVHIQGKTADPEQLQHAFSADISGVFLIRVFFDDGIDGCHRGRIEHFRGYIMKSRTVHSFRHGSAQLGRPVGQNHKRNPVLNQGVKKTDSSRLGTLTFIDQTAFHNQKTLRKHNISTFMNYITADFLLWYDYVVWRKAHEGSGENSSDTMHTLPDGGGDGI